MFLDYFLEQFEKNSLKTAIIWQDNEFSYKWMLGKIAEAGDFIRNNKIAFGSVVALRSDFNPHSIAYLLALIENGNICVPISYAVKKTDEYYDIAQVEFVIDIMEDKPTFVKRDVNEFHQILLKLKDIKHPGLILFSSGSTGKSKASVQDFSALLEKFKVKRHTLKTITFLLFDHIGGVNTLFYILSNCGTIIAPDDRNPDNICRLIEKYKVELLPTSPTFLNMILIHQSYKSNDISSLKMITYGTEAMPETTLKRFHELFPEIELKQTYGLSELGILRSKSRSSDSLWVKVGGEDYETKVVDDVLYIKAKTAMLGYLNAKSPFDIEGWFNTQDKVLVDGEWIKILGRETDIINVGGQKVYPAEVESVLLEIDNITEASVFGKENPLLGKIVAARISLKEDEPLSALKKRIRLFCKDKLESFKIPVDIEISLKLQVSDRFKKIR